MKSGSYGHLTWEWGAGIRSYMHPLLFAAPLRVPLRLLPFQGMIRDNQCMRACSCCNLWISIQNDVKIHAATPSEAIVHQ